MIEMIASNRRYPMRFQVGELKIGITAHALRRAQKRRINLMDRLECLRGKPLSRYKDYGVVARYKPYQNHLAIITVYNC